MKFAGLCIMALLGSVVGYAIGSGMMACVPKHISMPMLVTVAGVASFLAGFCAAMAYKRRYGNA